MAPPRTYTNERMLAALAQTRGLVCLAAKELGCKADTIRERAARSPEVAAAIRDHRAERVDRAESKLDLALDAGEAWAVSLVLCTLGKDRGYVKETRVAGHDGGPVEVVVKRVAALPGKNGSNGRERIPTTD
jgi:hypothetical protein